MTKLRAGLIQMSLKMDASRAPVEIREAMVAAHVPFIEEAARRGVPDDTRPRQPERSECLVRKRGLEPPRPCGH